MLVHCSSPPANCVPHELVCEGIRAPSFARFFDQRADKRLLTPNPMQFVSQFRLLPRLPLALRLLTALSAFGVIWLWMLNSVDLVIPLDNVEQLVWVRSMEWGYYKHPPLLTWLLWPVVYVVGLNSTATTVLGATISLTSVGLIYPMARKAGGQAFAVIALLGVLCVSFYSDRLHYYNHNTILTLWVALSAHIFLRLLLKPRLRWWLALGVVGGLGMLSKYQYALMIAPIAVLYVQRKMWQQKVNRLGLAVAALISASLVSPHLYWLLQQPAGPVDYAMNSALGQHMDAAQRLGHSLQWAMDWLLVRCLPALIIVAVGAYASGPACSKTRPQFLACEERVAARAILLLWGFTPFGVMLIIGLVSGTPLKSHWGTAFMLWTVPAVMVLLRLDTRTEPSMRLSRWLLASFVMLQAILLLRVYVSAANNRYVPDKSGWPKFPAREIAATLGPEARAVLGGPIRVIVGAQSVCGAIALELPEKPKVLIEGNRQISPWITDDEVRSGLVLWIWREADAPVGSHPLPGGLRWSS